MGEVVSKDPGIVIGKSERKVVVPLRERIVGTWLPALVCLLSVGFSVQAMVLIGIGETAFFSQTSILSLVWATFLLVFVFRYIKRETPEVKALRDTYGYDLPVARLGSVGGGIYHLLGATYLVDIREDEIRFLSNRHQICVSREAGIEIFVRRYSMFAIQEAGHRGSLLVVRSGEHTMRFEADDNGRLFEAAFEAEVEVRE